VPGAGSFYVVLEEDKLKLQIRIATLAMAAATFVVLTAATVSAQSIPTVTGDARVDKLLSQMTLAEKLKLIDGTQEDPAVYQAQAGYIAGVPRLGIPGLRFADGPPGVLTRVPSQGETATMGVAATFSIKDSQDNGLVIGREDRALGIDVSLQPFVNMVRDLEFGRAYNTFGEDPFLTSEMGVAEVKGIQSQHVMAQIKHYVGYDSDGTNIFIDDQTLHEIYIAPFEAAIRRADVSSIMCSYNRLNGAFACGNEKTLTNILRDELGFKGFVTSDWGAVHAVDFINAGLDMEMPGEPGSGIMSFMPTFFDAKPVPPAPKGNMMGDIMESFFGHLPEEPKPAVGAMGDFGVKLSPKKMPEALKDGTVTEAAITRAAGRVLYEMVHFGYLDGQSKHEVTKQSIEENAKIIQKTGEDAAVLLKNEGNILPLKSADLPSIVLIGPTAAQVDSIGISGERSVGLPQHQVGPLAAMKRISGNDQIGFSVADDMTGTTIPATALTHDGKPGLLRTGDAGEQVDPTLNFTVKGGTALKPNTTATWKGTLTVETGGEYWLYLQALGTNAALKIDGKKVGRTGATQGMVHGDILQANQDNAIPTTDGLDNVRRPVDLKAGAHEIEVNISPDTSSSPVQVRLNWYTPEQRKADHDAAIAAAKNAKIAVVFAWTRLQPVFGLPGDQDKLIEEIAAVNPNTVVVLNVSQPVALPWVDKVKAVLQMWWPGDEGGWATADVLLGKVSPAGRLPITWAKNLTDYAATDPKYPERSKNGVDGKTTYTEGVNIGYRWFDKQNTEPLFAFGHGLSYTTFDYSGLAVKKASDGGLDVTVTIKNTGSRDSDEVPQVYLGAPGNIPDGVEFPVRALAAFDRVSIKMGASRSVTLHVAPRQLQYWSTKENKWVTASGKRTVSVGGSSRDLRLHQEID
jgi:beta-glucosidase